jgi:hypothetical protein
LALSLVNISYARGKIGASKFGHDRLVEVLVLIRGNLRVPISSPDTVSAAQKPVD